jgi:hypothetical protein
VDPSTAKKGPEVAPGEELFRFVTVRSFWVAAESRPSSSLFDDPPRVSVQVASLTSIEKCRGQLRSDLSSLEGGMVSFNCGQARQLGFDARHEPENDNPAHAHLYCDATERPKERKKNAQRLARLCKIVIQPQFS